MQTANSSKVSEEEIKGSIEFKFNNYSEKWSQAKVEDYWLSIFESYFGLIYGFKKISIKRSDISINNISPHTQNSFVEIIRNDDGVVIASYYIYGQNNCCGALTTSNTYIASGYRNKKLGTLLQYYKEAIAYSNNISRMYCTDIYYEKLYDKLKEEDYYTIVAHRSNTKVLLNTGWKVIDLFLNNKSRNLVAMFSKEVKNNNKEIIMNIKLEEPKLVKIKNLTIGCDPELFLRTVDTKEFVPSYNYIKGDKKKPQAITDEGHNIQCDNVMLEYGVPPSKTPEEFIKNNMIVQNYISDKVAKPNGLEMVIFPYAEFTENNLKDKEKSERFGRLLPLL